MTIPNNGPSIDLQTVNGVSWFQTSILPTRPKHSYLKNPPFKFISHFHYFPPTTAIGASIFGPVTGDVSTTYGADTVEDGNTNGVILIDAYTIEGDQIFDSVGFKKPDPPTC